MAASATTHHTFVPAEIKERLQAYWSMIKSLQTGLLLSTGLAGYMSARCPVMHWPALLSQAGSLFLAISGSTVLNMWYDRDLDAKMQRTAHRPLPAGRLSPKAALRFGLLLSILGVGWALIIDGLFCAIVFAGLFFDVIVYTIWLKRRTAWSVVWGGISGGMPILAGRALGVGQIDWIGLMLALAVLFWIPTHIMTFSMCYSDDYRRAGIPTFPSTCGERATRWVIALASLAAALGMASAAYGIGMTWGYLRVLAVLSAGLLALAISSLLRPSVGVNFGLFKYASLYMLSTMALLVAEVAR